MKPGKTSPRPGLAPVVPLSSRRRAVSPDAKDECDPCSLLAAMLDIYFTTMKQTLDEIIASRRSS
jgi:hypothetical protein